MSKEFSFNSLSINKFTTGGEFNYSNDGLKYHYTSPEAFLSIISNSSIRFTDIKYLNDRSVSIYFVKLLLDFMDEHRKKYQYTQEIINLILDKNEFRKIQELDINSINYNEIRNRPYKQQRRFIFCMSNDADSLNMWNYYVNNGKYQGYNIGFNMNKLIKTFDTSSENENEKFIVYYGNVLYKQNQQFDEIKVIVEDIEKRAKNGISKDVLALKLREYIDLQGAFYKHNKFISENEFRIVIVIDEETIPRSKDDAKNNYGKNNKHMLEQFYIKNGLIVPCLNIALPKDCISRITVSPITEFEIAKKSIQELLRVKGFSDYKIYKSVIPIRF